MSFLHILLLALGLYVSMRCVLPLPLPLWTRLIVSLVVLACAMKFFWFHLIFDSFTPELHRNILAVGGIMQGGVIVLGVLYLLRDALFGALFLARHWNPAVPHIPLSTSQWSILLVTSALLITVAAVWQGLRVPDVRRISISLPRLPAALDGLRIVQLSDLHISTGFPRVWAEELTARVNALKPDIIVITGDMVDGTVTSRAADVAPLANLHAALGVFACLGNHEYYWGGAAWIQKIRSLGITLLHNEHVTLSARGQSLTLAGITDEAALKAGLPGPDLAAALKDAPNDTARILLAHRPNTFDSNASRTDLAAPHIDLQLSGHTHGGQLFFLAPTVKHFNAGYLVGHYARNASQMYVSPGSALWGGFPLRIFRPSEITEITLRAGSASDSE